MAAAAGAAAARGLAVLGGEGGTAAAGADRVRVVDLEAAAHRILDIVDISARDIVYAERVDQDAHAVLLELDVALFYLVGDSHTVLQPGASAAGYEDAERGILDSLRVKKALDLGRGL